MDVALTCLQWFFAFSSGAQGDPRSEVSSLYFLQDKASGRSPHDQVGTTVAGRFPWLGR